MDIIIKTSKQEILKQKKILIKILFIFNSSFIHSFVCLSCVFVFCVDVIVQSMQQKKNNNKLFVFFQDHANTICSHYFDYFPNVCLSFCLCHLKKNVWMNDLWRLIIMMINDFVWDVQRKKNSFFFIVTMNFFSFHYNYLLSFW